MGTLECTGETCAAGANQARNMRFGGAGLSKLWRSCSTKEGEGLTATGRRNLNSLARSNVGSPLVALFQVLPPLTDIFPIQLHWEPPQLDCSGSSPPPAAAMPDAGGHAGWTSSTAAPPPPPRSRVLRRIGGRSPRGLCTRAACRQRSASHLFQAVQRNCSESNNPGGGSRGWTAELAAAVCGNGRSACSG